MGSRKVPGAKKKTTSYEPISRDTVTGTGVYSQSLLVCREVINTSISSPNGAERAVVVANEEIVRGVIYIVYAVDKLFARNMKLHTSNPRSIKKENLFWMVSLAMDNCLA
ncbi:hypothetical protein Tco_0649083 [Tanacetum coccineum]